MSSSEVVIRRAKPADIPSINAIHKNYVQNTVVTFMTEPNSDEDAAGNYEQTKALGLPYIVATNQANETVLGYSYVSPFRGVKPGYRHTLELSLFCHLNHVRKGVGRQLLTRMINILKAPEDHREWFEGMRLNDSRPKQLMAVMSVDVEGPGNGLKLRDWYLQFGFEQRGHLKEVGWKMERWIDTIYLQLPLPKCNDILSENGSPDLQYSQSLLSATALSVRNGERQANAGASHVINRVKALALGLGKEYCHLNDLETSISL
ncbi:hypothetical protein LTR37_016497 [Vermiconidia calcicola]|uniref:Uncharacterized protein n=1 Tax=Vermiconidia calcicola TaxID=1690605 RepID=A0ACC3MMW6_9PEZI|nr:hypothetical protein LTR37_016497 [Vermiconidia calcicola]